MSSTDDASQGPLQRYPSLAAFYNADSARLASRELDVGLWWRDELDGPLHRAAWVLDTGELYLARLGFAEERAGDVQVLARVKSRERLESVLEGWRDACGAPRSLQWLRVRAARLAQGTGRPRLRVRESVGPTLV